MAVAKSAHTLNTMNAVAEPLITPKNKAIKSVPMMPPPCRRTQARLACQ
jgi:hypothetical protein